MIKTILASALVLSASTAAFATTAEYDETHTAYDQGTPATLAPAEWRTGMCYPVDDYGYEYQALLVSLTEDTTFTGTETRFMVFNTDDEWGEDPNSAQFKADIMQKFNQAKDTTIPIYQDDSGAWVSRIGGGATDLRLVSGPNGFLVRKDTNDSDPAVVGAEYCRFDTPEAQ